MDTGISAVRRSWRLKASRCRVGDAFDPMLVGGSTLAKGESVEVVDASVLAAAEGLLREIVAADLDIDPERNYQWAEEWQAKAESFLELVQAYGRIDKEGI